MTRRSFLGSSAGVLAAAQSGVSQPNILFILADDLGWGDLGCYGNGRIQTPTLDQLARDGALFTQFYVNSPVCSPSRTAFLTSHFPARHRMHGHLAAHPENAARAMPNFLDPAIRNLPSVLREVGYRTAHVGKWHLGSGEGAPLPGEYGFDYVRSSVSNDRVWAEKMKQPYFWGRSMSLLADESIRFLDAAGEQPFYLQLWTMLPHATLNPTEDQMAPYRRFGPKESPHRGATEIYYAAVSDLDRQIGRVLAKLEETGKARNTIVVFSSDNGPEDMEIFNAAHSAAGSAGPLRGRKRSLYEGGVRVPFIVRWPDRIRPGTVDTESVLSAVDCMPTLARLCGADVTSLSFDGEDRSSVLTGAPSRRSKPLFWEWRFNIFGHPFHRSPRLAIREGDWKLLCNPDGSRTELYNLRSDPREMINQAAAESERAERLRQQLISWSKTLPGGPSHPQAGRDDYPWPGKKAQ